MAELTAEDQKALDWQASQIRGQRAMETRRAGLRGSAVARRNLEDMWRAYLPYFRDCP